MATHATHAKGAPPYQTREATCEQCGKIFMARKYPGRNADWTRYCSRSCSGKANRPVDAFSSERRPRRAPTPAVSAEQRTAPALVESSAQDTAESADEEEYFWWRGRWMTQAELDAEVEADRLAPATSATSEPTPPMPPDEPAPAAAEVSAETADDDATLAQDETPDEPDLSAGYAVLATWLTRLFKTAPQPLLSSLPLMLPLMAGGAALGDFGPFATASAAPAQAEAATVATTVAEDETEAPSPPTYPLLRALLDRLPPQDATWTRSAYERWLRAFTATLQLDVVIVDDGAAEEERTRK